jgi:hypothetical protein
MPLFSRITFRRSGSRRSCARHSVAESPPGAPVKTPVALPFPTSGKYTPPRLSFELVRPGDRDAPTLEALNAASRSPVSSSSVTTSNAGDSSYSSSPATTDSVQASVREVRVSSVQEVNCAGRATEKQNSDQRSSSALQEVARYVRGDKAPKENHADPPVTSPWQLTALSIAAQGRAPSIEPCCAVLRGKGGVAPILVELAVTSFARQLPSPPRFAGGSCDMKSWLCMLLDPVHEDRWNSAIDVLTAHSGTVDNLLRNPDVLSSFCAGVVRIALSTLDVNEGTISTNVWRHANANLPSLNMFKIMHSLVASTAWRMTGATEYKELLDASLERVRTAPGAMSDATGPLIVDRLDQISAQ